MLGLFVFLALKPAGRSFVLIGPPNFEYHWEAWGNHRPKPPFGEVPELGYTDPWGAPKEKDLLFRWTLPDFTYAFDASFVNYFGPEGMEAVHDAVHVINDFFENEEYSGVSALDLHKHGFAGNFNTTWKNTTAQNGQVLDIKSMVLGTMVNFLGLGNPHQHMWTISTIYGGPHQPMWTNISGVPTLLPPTSDNAYWKIGANLRNYDPLSHQPTHRINNVLFIT